jgi:ABC-type transporter Mla subunit MlaD
MPAVEERVDRLDRIFAAFMQQTSEAIAELRESRRDSNRRMEEFARRTDQFGERTDQFSRGIDEFSQRMDQFSRGMDEFSQRMDQFSQRMDQSSQRMDQFSQRMDEYNIRAEKDRAESAQKWQDWLRKSDEHDRRIDQERKEFNRKMAEISASVGRIVEDLVIPNAERVAREIFPSDPVLRVLPRAKAYLGGESMEIDLIAPGERNVILIEARHRLDASDVREMLDKLALFPKFFPEYARHRVILVAASLAIEESLRKFLTRQRVYGLAMGDETMELVNLGEF